MLVGRGSILMSIDVPVRKSKILVLISSDAIARRHKDFVRYRRISDYSDSVPPNCTGVLFMS